MSGVAPIFKNRKSRNGTNVEATLAEISHREGRGSTRPRTTTVETPHTNEQRPDPQPQPAHSASSEDAASSVSASSLKRYIFVFTWTIILYFYVFWQYLFGDLEGHRPFLLLPAGIYADLDSKTAHGIPEHWVTIAYFGLGAALIYIAYRLLGLKDVGFGLRRPSNFRGFLALMFATFACFGAIAPGILMDRYALPPHLTANVYEGWLSVQHSADGALPLYTWCTLTLTGLFLTVYLENVLIKLRLPLWAILTITCVAGALPWLRYDSFSRFFGIFWTIAIAFIYLATRTGWGLIVGNTIYVAFLVGMTYAHTIHDDALLFAFATPFTLLIFATLILPVAVGGGGIYRLHWLELHRTSTDPQGLHLGDY